MTLLRRVLATLLFIVIAIPATAQPVPQTPITVQVINNSGLPDSAIYVLLAGKDIDNTTAGTPATIPAGGTSTLTISLPNEFASGATVSEPFTSTMPTVVTAQ